MKKNYLLITFLILVFFVTQQGFSQSSTGDSASQPKIENLSIYPNPVSNGRTFIYITTKRNLTKNIEIYNVLGKKIFRSVLVGRELNISELSTGVYVLKVIENNISETRKLIIK